MTFYENRPRTSSGKRTESYGGSRLLSAYFHEVAKLTIPTAAREHELLQAYKTETDPKEKRRLKGEIAKGYLRFVIKQALHRTHDETLVLDLINAGNEGLLVAIDKFDIDKGNRFLTYGAWWIRVHIQNALKDAGLGRPSSPTPAMNDDSDEDQAVPITVQYLSDPSFLPSSNPSAETLLSNASFNVMKALHRANLSRREALILIYYYGLRGGQRHTFSQLAHLLYELDGRFISSERVRQLKEHAVKQLKKGFIAGKMFSASDVI